MAVKKEDIDKASIEKRYSIEVLKEKYKIPSSIFEGVKVLKGWAAGKQILEKEYQDAVELFLKAPIDNKKRQVKKDATQ